MVVNAGLRRRKLPGYDDRGRERGFLRSRSRRRRCVSCTSPSQATEVPSSALRTWSSTRSREAGPSASRRSQISSRELQRITERDYFALDSAASARIQRARRNPSTLAHRDLLRARCASPARGEGRPLRKTCGPRPSAHALSASRLVLLRSRRPTQACGTQWERFATRWSANTICVSEDERLSGEAAGIRGRWTVIPNGVDTGRWRPPSSDERAQARRALASPQDATLAVTVARLHRAKGVDVLLRAWSELHLHAPSARLIVVGDGPEMANLTRACPGGVTLAGAADPRQCLSAADVFVAPSRWEAGASLAVMEAMAQGLPVVATQVDGMAAILERRYLAPVDDPRALARILEELLGDATPTARHGRSQS